VLFFAAFLCKYVVALFFPFLVLICLRERRSALLFFSLPLAALCALYAALYVHDLSYLLSYGGSYEGLRAGASEQFRVYVRERVDFWVLAAFSLLAWKWHDTKRVRLALALWLGVFTLLLFQWSTGADFDYWKHVNYALLFLIPLACAGFLRMIRRWSEQQFFVLATLGVLVLSVALGWAGGTWQPARHYFWPNVEPVLAYFEYRLHPQSRVLTDDSVLRYYLRKQLDSQSRIVDPFHFAYPYADAWPNLRVSAPAYAKAVQQGHFDFIVLDGGVGPDAQELAAAIRPVLAENYALRLDIPDAIRARRLEVYERIAPPPFAPPARESRIEITAPLSGSTVMTKGIATQLVGYVHGAPAGAVVRVDVFTNRWYPQGNGIPLAADGRFEQTIHLGGMGASQCAHMIRARLLDASGNELHAALAYSVARAEANGSPPPCRAADAQPEP
jgi:hypothetical protein